MAFLLVHQHVMQVIARITQRNYTGFTGFCLVRTQAHSPTFQIHL